MKIRCKDCEYCNYDTFECRPCVPEADEVYNLTFDIVEFYEERNCKFYKEKINENT